MQIIFDVDDATFTVVGTHVYTWKCLWFNVS